MGANFNAFSVPKTILPTRRSILGSGKRMTYLVKPVGFRNLGVPISVWLGHGQSCQGAMAAKLIRQGVLDKR
jgi:hypothetical protein